MGRNLHYIEEIEWVGLYKQLDMVSDGSESRKIRISDSWVWIDGATISQ